MPDGNNTRGNIHDHLGYEIRIETGNAATLMEFLQLLFKCTDAPVARGPYNTYFGTLVFTHFGKIEPCIANGLVTGSHRVLGKHIVLLDFLLFEMVFGPETFYLAGKMGFKLRGIKFGDRSCTAFAGYNVLPEFGYGIAQGRKGAQPGDNDSFHIVLLQFSGYTCSGFGFIACIASAGEDKNNWYRSAVRPVCISYRPFCNASSRSSATTAGDIPLLPPISCEKSVLTSGGINSN